MQNIRSQHMQYNVKKLINLCNNKQKYNIMKVSHLVLGCINNKDIHKYICNKMDIYIPSNMDTAMVLNDRNLLNICLSLIYKFGTIYYYYGIKPGDIKKHKWLFCDTYCPEIISSVMYKQNKEIFLSFMYNTFNYVITAQYNLLSTNNDDEYLYALTDYIRNTDYEYFMTETIVKTRDMNILEKIVSRYSKDLNEVFYCSKIGHNISLFTYILTIYHTDIHNNVEYIDRIRIHSITELYVKYGGDINKNCPGLYSPLEFILCNTGIDDYLPTLFKNGVDINKIGSYGLTPLIFAIYHNSSVIIYLINNGANMNKCSLNGVSPLMMAIYKNKKELTYNLLNNGANSNHKDNYGYTVLDYALYSKHIVDIRFVSMLISYGAVSHNFDPDKINCRPQDRERLRKILGHKICDIM